MTPERLNDLRERMMRYRHGHLKEWQRRQADADRAYALRASAVMEAEVARLMAMDEMGWDDGADQQTTGVR